MAGHRDLTRILQAGLLLASLACLAACSGPAPEPSATPTAPPTSIPAPSATPMPTLTPTPAPQPGGTILCSAQTGSSAWLAEIPLDGSPARLLNIEGRDAVFDPASPGMAYLAPTGSGYEIVLARLDGAETGRIPSPQGLDSSPAFKPDGGGLAFARMQSRYSESGLLTQRSWDILFFNPRKQRIIPLLDSPSNETSPAWSPDSTRLAFLSDLSGFSEIYLLDLETNSTSRLTSDQRLKQDLVWSPDGQWLAYAAPTLEGQSDIFMVSADTGAAVMDFPLPGLDQQPVFSPDSQWLAFTNGHSGIWRIQLAHLPTRYLLLLPARPENCREPAWRP